MFLVNYLARGLKRLFYSIINGIKITKEKKRGKNIRKSEKGKSIDRELLIGKRRDVDVIQKRKLCGKMDL